MKGEEAEIVIKKRFVLKQTIASIIGITFIVALATITVVTFTLVFIRTNSDVFALSSSELYAFIAAMWFIFIVGFAFGIPVLGSILRNNRVLDLLLKFTDFTKKIAYLTKSRNFEESKIIAPGRYQLLKISEIFFSAETQKEVFLQAMIDWDEEIYEVLEKNKNASLFMINARNTYAFLAAMWQKSPLGDLIEFIGKIAK